MVNVVVMGECMIEFSAIENDVYKQSFAGDVYNTAVYLKRLQNDFTKVSILTGVGADDFSKQMISDFKLNGIDTSFVQYIEDRQPGTYLIQTSDLGERSFIYWRESSAAKSCISKLNNACKHSLINQCDIFYFSGISIAILDKQDRDAFWQLLTQLRDSGSLIVFDSNFRRNLWCSTDDAASQFKKAFEISSIVFAGVEDFELLYDLSNFTSINNFLADYSISELIIKNGPDGIFYRSTNSEFTYEIEPIANVIDTTSAGDSFNSGYLSARINKCSALNAIKHACRVSGCIIQYKGAIIDSKLFSHFLNKENKQLN